MTLAMSRWSQSVLGIFAFTLAACMPVAARADTVYAVSNNDGRIIRYDSTNPAGSVVTLSGSGAILNAAGLAIGPDGNLYVGENGDFSTIAPNIKRLDLTNNLLSTVYSFQLFDVFPGALLFKGSDLLVGRNPFFSNTGAIVKIANATGGSAVATDYTSGVTLASSPGLALGPDGALYVSNQTYDFGTNVASGPVLKFNASGSYIGEVIASGTTSGLYGPTGLGIQGPKLFTSSIMNGAVLQTSLLDDSTTSFGTTGVPFGASPLAVLSDGSVLAGSAGAAGAIYEFDGSGNLVGTFNSGLGTIGGLAVVPVPEPASIVTAMIALAGVTTCLRCRGRSRQ
ncbi:MAG: hypothetical protein ACKOEM_13730 [Planctomycetia bacterium]